MATGTIRRVVIEKGYGFIASTNSDGDLFFHRSALRMGEFDKLTEGVRVEFELGESPKGPRAERVSIITQ